MGFGLSNSQLGSAVGYCGRHLGNGIYLMRQTKKKKETSEVQKPHDWKGRVVGWFLDQWILARSGMGELFHCVLLLIPREEGLCGSIRKEEDIRMGSLVVVVAGHAVCQYAVQHPNSHSRAI